MLLSPTPPSSDDRSSSRSSRSRAARRSPMPPAPPPLNTRLYQPPASAPPSASKLLSRPFGYLAAPTPAPAPAPAVIEPLTVANLVSGVLSPSGGGYTSNLHARSEAYMNSRRALQEAKMDAHRLKATLHREQALAAADAEAALPDYRPPDHAFDESEEGDELERERILAQTQSPTRIIARREHPYVPRVYLAEEQVMARARAAAAGEDAACDSPTAPDSPVKVDHFGLLHSFQLQLTRPANLTATPLPATAAAPALPTKQPLVPPPKAHSRDATSRPSLDFAGVAFSALPATAAHTGISPLSAFVNLRAASPAAASMVLSVAGAEHARKTSTLSLPGATAGASSGQQHHSTSSLSINISNSAPASASAAAAAPASPSNAATTARGSPDNSTAASASTGLAAPSGASIARSSSSSSVGGSGGGGSAGFNLPAVLKGSPGFHYMPKAREGAGATAAAASGGKRPLSRAEERRREKEFEREKRELVAFLLGTDTAATATTTDPAATGAPSAQAAAAPADKGHRRTLSFAKTHAPPRSRSRSRSRKPVSPPAKMRPSSSAAAAPAPPSKPSMASILTGSSDASRAATAALAAAAAASAAAAQTARDASPLRYMHTSRTATSPVRHVLHARATAANAHTTLTLHSKRQLEHDRKARALFEQVTSGNLAVDGADGLGADGAATAPTGGNKFGFGLDLSVEEVARNSKQEQRLISGLLTGEAKATAAATAASMGPSTLLRTHTSAARSGSDVKEGAAGSGNLSKQVSGTLATGGVAGSSSVQGSAMLGTVDESSQTSSSQALATAESLDAAAAAAVSSKEQRARDSAVAAGEFTPLSPELVNALVKATKRGDATTVADLIAQCPEHQRLEFINMKDRNGSTAIFHTVWPGHFFALRMLLQKGADPNIQNVKKNTALHLAVERGHKNLIRCLLEHGADPTLRNAADLLCFQTPPNPDDRVLMERFIANTAAEVKRGTVSTYKLDMSAGFLAQPETNPFVRGYYSAAWRRATDSKWAQQAEEAELKEALEWTPPVPSVADKAAAEEQSLTHNGQPHPSQYELRLAPWFGKFVSRSLRAAERRAGTLPPTEEQMHRAWARKDRRARRKARREERRVAKEKQAAAGFGSPPSTAASRARPESSPLTATTPGFSAPNTAAYRMRNMEPALMDGDPNAEHFPANPAAEQITATEDEEGDLESDERAEPAAADDTTASAAKPPRHPHSSSSRRGPQLVAATGSSRPSSGRGAAPLPIALAAPGPHSNTSAATATFAFLPHPPSETLGTAEMRGLPARASMGVELVLANRPVSVSGEDRAVAAVNVAARVQKRSMSPQSPRRANLHSRSLELSDLASSASSSVRHFAAPPGDAVHDLERSLGQPVGNVTRASFIPPISARMGDAHEAASVLAPPWSFSDDAGTSARWATALSDAAQPLLGAHVRSRMTSEQLADVPPRSSSIVPSVYPEHFPFHDSLKQRPVRSLLTPPSVVARAVELGILEDKDMPLAGVAQRRDRSKSVSPSRKLKAQAQLQQPQDRSSMLVDAALRTQGADLLSSARALTGLPMREQSTASGRRSASYGGEQEEKQALPSQQQHHSATAVKPGSVQWHAQRFADLPATTRPSTQPAQLSGSMSARTSTAPAHASRSVSGAIAEDATGMPLFSSFAATGRPSTSAASPASASARRPPRPPAPPGSALVGTVVSQALAAPMPPSVTVLQEGRDYQFASVQQQQQPPQPQQARARTSHAAYKRPSAPAPPVHARSTAGGSDAISRRFVVSTEAMAAAFAEIDARNQAYTSRPSRHSANARAGAAVTAHPQRIASAAAAATSRSSAVVSSAGWSLSSYTPL